MVLRNPKCFRSFYCFIRFAYSALTEQSTSCMTEIAGVLSWLHDWTMWIYACHCNWLSDLLQANEMYQDMPCFPNQSACDSRFLFIRKFIAQSFTVSTVSLSRKSHCAWSWLNDHNMWHCHDRIVTLILKVRHWSNTFDQGKF